MRKLRQTENAAKTIRARSAPTPKPSKRSYAQLRRSANSLETLYRRGRLTRLLNQIANISPDIQVQRLNYAVGDREVVYALRRHTRVIFAIRLGSGGTYSVNGAPLQPGWQVQLQAIALPRRGARDSIVVKPPYSTSRGIYLRISRKLFATLAADLIGDRLLAERETFHLHGPVSTAIGACAEQIVGSTLTGKALEFFLAAKSMELTILCVTAMPGLRERAVEPVSLRPADRDRLHRVWHALGRDFSEHLTMAGLAKDAGINVNKLKFGFRWMFGCTVFERLRHVRLQEGARRMATSDDTIATIAQGVGYRNATHFAVAFRNHYGCSPRAFRRMRQTEALHAGRAASP